MMPSGTQQQRMVAMTLKEIKAALDDSLSAS